MLVSYHFILFLSFRSVGFVISIMIGDILTNDSCVLYLLIKYTVSTTWNTHDTGFLETIIVSRQHWMNAFIFLFIPAVILICPLFTVNVEYDFRSSSNSLMVWSIHEWNSSSNTSNVVRSTFVDPLKKIGSMTPHSIIASRTVYKGGGTAIFSVIYHYNIGTDRFFVS